MVSPSACIRRLEQRIGEPLFERGTHPVSLTPCGEEYVRVACAMEDLEEGFETFVSERRGCARGELRLGGSNFNITCILPELYQRFQERYPGIQVDVVEGDIDRLEALRQICLYKKKSRRMRAPMRAFAALVQQVFEDG